MSAIGLKNHVAAFGPLARNSEWCLSLKTDAAKDRVLSAGTLKVRGSLSSLGRRIGPSSPPESTGLRHISPM